jgi:hypothetical protein
MNAFSKITIVAAMVTATFQFAFAFQPVEPLPQTLWPDSTANTGGKGSCINIAVDNIPVSPLSVKEKEGLVFMREEEKLAHDVYIALAQVWDIPVFNNISQSETAHMQAVLSLLEKYGIADPVTDEKAGAFTNKAFTDLYLALVKQGKVNLIDALRAGALIEETDIADLRDRMKESDNADINQVYDNLLQASYRHMRAFSRNLAFRDAPYTPQRLSQKEMDEILDAE